MRKLISQSPTITIFLDQFVGLIHNHNAKKYDSVLAGCHYCTELYR